jgi:hypothetical protein
MAITYTIGTKNVITFDINGAQVVQPAFPDGTKWASKAQAEEWAKLFVAHLKDPAAPRPGNGPDKLVLEVEDLEMSAEEIAALELAMAEEEARIEALAAPVPVEIPGESESGEDIIDAEVVDESTEE